MMKHTYRLNYFTLKNKQLIITVNKSEFNEKRLQCWKARYTQFRNLLTYKIHKKTCY